MSACPPHTRWVVKRKSGREPWLKKTATGDGSHRFVVSGEYEYRHADTPRFRTTKTVKKPGRSSWASELPEKTQNDYMTTAIPLPRLS
jgi:hypothetical protein